MTDSADPIAQGRQARASGDWAGVLAAFEGIGHPTAEVLDAIGEARWWLGMPDEALQARTEAYAAHRDEGDDVAAVRLAVWLAREYRFGRGTEEVAQGWHRRAARLLEQMPEGPAYGWVALLDAESEHEPARAVPDAERSLEVARQHGDLDGELRALAKLGLVEVAAGRLTVGMERLGEALAAVTSETIEDWETFGYVYCDFSRACEVAGDLERVNKWNDVIVAYLEAHPHAPLIAYCGSCGGELFGATGDWDTAESCLTDAIEMLEAVGESVRCVHPVARLAELRIAQGRFEDAAELLAGYEGLPEAVRPTVQLHLVRGEYDAAGVALRRRLTEVGETSLLAVPLLLLAVDVALARDDVPDARQAAKQLAQIGERSGVARVATQATLARGRLASAAGDTDAAEFLDEAVVGFVRLGMPMDEARSRLELARVLASDNEELATNEARTALAIFDRLGATHDADETSALLRRLGPAGRAGPKGHGTLTRRETEVLRLVAHGLTNAEIAERLFIATKTAGNHVSSILTKLGLRNRAEAASHAQRHLPS